ATGETHELSRWARQSALRTMETLRALRTTQGDLYHTTRRQVSGWLPDLALVAHASLRLQLIEPSERNRRFAQSLLRIVRANYADPTGGLYDVPLAMRWGDWTLQPVRATADEATPADDMLVAMTFLEAGETAYAKQLLQVALGDFNPNQPERYFGLATVLELYDTLSNGDQQQ
ncbi:MAG: hypothetical protein SNJ72_10245, partial [Fimbriimonadales bacterium]